MMKLVLLLLALLSISPAQAAKTQAEFGVDRTVSPWQFCAYDQNMVCQPVFSLTLTSGGPIWLGTVGLSNLTGLGTGVATALAGPAGSGAGFATYAQFASAVASLGPLATLSPIGTGVATALGQAAGGTNANSLLLYSNVGTSGATIPLNNTANVFSAVQTDSYGEIIYGSGSLVNLYASPPTSQLYLSRGYNLSVSPITGHPAGDSTRVNLYGIDATQYDATKAEYNYDFETNINTGYAPQWQQSHAYVAGNQIDNNGNLYQETATSCTSAGTGTGPSGTSTPQTDNTCSWTYLQADTTNNKVGVAVSTVMGANAAHSWGAAIDTVWNQTIYPGMFGNGVEIDTSLGNTLGATCAIGTCTINALYISGYVFGELTSEINMAQSAGSGAPAWIPNHVYTAGQTANVNGGNYVVTVGGTSAGSGGPSGTGSVIVDGTVTWKYPWAAYFGIMGATQTNFIQSAFINDGTSAVDGTIYYGAHSNADLDATNQSYSTTPAFARLATGQAICWANTTGCARVTTSTLVEFYTPDSATSYLELSISGGTGGYGSMIAYSDHTTYNWGVGGGTGGAFEWWNGRYAGNAGTKVAALDSSGDLVLSGYAKAIEFLAGGSTPTITGSGSCTLSTQVGGSTAGTFKATAACAAAQTYTISAMPTATNGYVCDAGDRTTSGVVFQQTSDSATTAVLTVRTTGVSNNDIIQFKCTGY